MSEPHYLDRPPRIQPELPAGDQPVPRPPGAQRETPGRLVQIGLPLLTLAGYVLVAGLGGGSRLLMIPMGLSVLASVGFSLYTLRRERQQRAADERAYAERLRELRKEMQTSHELQRRFYHYNYPDPATISQLATHAARGPAEPADGSRLPARLYERRPGDDDFAMLRLGIGTRPSSVRYTLDQTDAPLTPQLRAAQKLASDSLYVDDVPLTLALRPPPERDDNAQREEQDATRSPLAHALGIAGERSGVYAFVRSLLAHYTAFHAPADARLFILAEQRPAWAWAAALPHCRGDEPLRQICFVAEAAPAADEDSLDDDGGDLEQYLEGLRRLLAQRKIRTQEHDASAETGDARLPFLLVVVDLLDGADNPASPLQHVASDAALAILLEEGMQLGAAVLFLLPERNKIPGNCQVIIEIERSAAAGDRRAGPPPLHMRFAEAGLNSTRYIGIADSLATNDDIVGLAQALSALSVRQSGGANLSATVPFLELVGCADLTQLRERARRRWQASVDPAGANWLRARLGLMAGNKPRTMVFSAKRDGVHGIVAGSTGSGKSELLIALICGLAMNYDPGALNFVLVDYKGGGAFQGFAGLPHCVDIVTNLAGDGVTRMFTAIGAEMRRRQALNASTGTKDIVDYRRKGLHLSHQPYPFLFIIVDEFAEMIAVRPEYRAELESIARVGRAQGVSLILAAQRPSGVTDQMRSNIKFRICLRVESPGESRELLRRGDAAFLPAGLPGRGYLQVGNDAIEQIQVAYAGGVYRDPQRPQAPAVIWPERGGNYDDTQDQPAPELYKAIIDSLAGLAVDTERPRQRAPWPAALPFQLALSTLLVSNAAGSPALTSRDYLANIAAITLGQPEEPDLSLCPALLQWQRNQPGWITALDWSTAALRPVAGLIDDPAGARQVPLVIDLARGHALIVGASGSGKTTLLRSTLISLVASHGPGSVHLYVFDLGGRGLALLGELPHSGAVISPEEDGFAERAEQVLREIGTIVERRKHLLNDAGVDDIWQYNRANPAAPEPVIVLAIDNLRAFVETFGAVNDDVETVFSRLVGLARQARPYGFVVLATTSQAGDLSGPLMGLFSERFALRLGEIGDYRAILGASVPTISDIPGRGYTLVGRTPLAFQAALPLDPEQSADPAAANRELAELCAQMRRHAATLGSYPRPVRVDALPRAVLLRRLLAQAGQFDTAAPFLPQLAAATRTAWAASMDPEQADWLQVPIGAVAGGRTRVLELEAKKDGVHGMVAGGTGSGKSELLMTLIVGLALRYDPRVLNFVLVDYKGGGAFKPFDDLPHCVESVTNLNKADVQRMFTAIGAEMRRRQQLNSKTNTKDIVEYRKKGLHLTHAPYPHLFIIIDEYAEMIAESPEFGAELDSITRVGRAQGVNLLLAAQRPTGVSDQMRANIKLRICLRVEGTDTSRELLRRADAAYLPNGMPGRGYIQAGYEPIELAQIAFTGDRDPEAAPNEAGEQPRFFEVVVAMANQLLEQERPAAPWPPVLPTALTLETPLSPAYLAAGPASESVDPTPVLCPAAAAWCAGHGHWPGIDWEHSAMRAVVGLADDPAGARQAPVVLDLSRGHGVVFGASGWGKTTLLRSLALSLAATHSPAELHIHALDLGGRGLEPLDELPHKGTRISPDEPGYEERIQQLWREINELLDQRKRLLSAAGTATLAEYNAARPEQAEPALLLLIDNIGELIETFGSDNRGGQANVLEQFVALARQGRSYGLHIVVTAPRLSTLSSKLYSLFTERLSLRLAEADDYSAIVGARPPEIEELPGRGYARLERAALAFQAALIPGVLDAEGRVRGEAHRLRTIGGLMQAAAQSLPSGRRPLCIDALPKSVLMQEIVAETMGISREPGRFIAELAAAVQERWARNATADQADWLRVPIGTISGGRTRELRLEAKHDGVHGIVAGGTGSGKSELLMTLIVGLALNYSPDILNFVLVDYKGGGAFKPFTQLPHCVDIVTNLNQAGVVRMFTAIGAEIARRQALNAETNTKDIVDYRRKGLHLTHAPYPHLFIIIDEYAEMIDANDNFRLALDSITRVGRAQGVNLLLASQQPKGVSDQMRANIKLRLCLRVEQQETSRELLRRPDAALLPSGQPGRGYLQVGNEPIELIQVAYAGAVQVDDRPAPACWPERALAGAAAGEEPPRFFDTIVALTRELYGGRSAPRPWPPFLPERLSLEMGAGTANGRPQPALLPAIAAWLAGDRRELWPGLAGGAGALCPVAGIIDRPAAALQDPLHLDLGRSHLAIFGDSGSGKTSFLRTVLYSLAATHSPDELHVYALDLGGRGLRSIAELPHVGAVIYGDEELFEERLQRLLSLLARTVETRQQLVSEAGAGSVVEYNARNPVQALPAILLVVDNIAELLDGYESLVDSGLIPLTRRALSAGITLLITANGPSGMPGRLAGLFGERLTFRQTNPDRYMDIVGRGTVEIDDIPGRGYIRRDGRALLFQAALPVGHPASAVATPEADELRLLATAMTAETTVRERRLPPPDPIRTLDTRVMLSDLLRQADVLPNRPGELLLGLGENLEPLRLDLRTSGLHCLIVGPPRSGRTTALASVALALAERYSPQQAGLVFVDLQRGLVDYGGEQSLTDLPHALAAVQEPEQLAELVERLAAECRSLAESGGTRALYLLIDNLEELTEELDSRRELAQRLVGLVRRHGRDGFHVVATAAAENTSSDLKRRILAGGLGLALCSAAALGVLSTQRTPAALRRGELSPGRGFLLRAGKLSQLQVATAYSPADEEDFAPAIDRWVQAARQRAGDARACWMASPAAAEASTEAIAAPAAWAGAERRLRLLQRGMRWEYEENGLDDQHDEPILARFARLDPEQWTSPTILDELLRALWLRILSRRGLDTEIASSAISELDEESILMALEGELPQ